jgi:hypothetical protein
MMCGGEENQYGSNAVRRANQSQGRGTKTSSAHRIYDNSTRKRKSNINGISKLGQMYKRGSMNLPYSADLPQPDFLSPSGEG